MPESSDVHDAMHGITAEAHRSDLAIQAEEGVDVKRIHQRAGHPTDQVDEVPVAA